MKSLSFAFLSLLLACGQTALALRTTTVTVLQEPSPTTTLPAKKATVAHNPSSSTPVTSTSSQPTKPSSHTTLVTSTSSSPYVAETSVVQATRTQKGYSAQQSFAPGAEGTDSGSFSLSKGGLIAIIVVIAVVVIFGAASITLWYLAKRRQWNVRASIRRMSRRLTGRPDKTTQRSDIDRRKRSGLVAGSKKAAVTAVKPPGHKRGLVVQVDDEEKGLTGPKRPREKTWIRRLWGNDWK